MIDISSLNHANDILEDLEIIASVEDDYIPERISIRMNGVLSHSNTAEFTDSIMDFFNGDWKRAVIIMDLSRLQYISSSGIGAFTTIRMQADHKESPLYLLSMNPKVRQVFDQLGFSSFFRIIDSPEEI